MSAVKTFALMSLLRDVNSARILSGAVAFARLVAIVIVKTTAGPFASPSPLSISARRDCTAIINIHNLDNVKTLRRRVHRIDNTKKKKTKPGD